MEARYNNSLHEYTNDMSTIVSSANLQTALTTALIRFIQIYEKMKLTSSISFPMFAMIIDC